MQQARVRDPLIFVTVPTFANVALSLKRSGLVYLRSDLHSAYPGANGDLLRRCEERLFSHADLILYSNVQLFRTEKGRLGDRAHYIGHGVDVAEFTAKGPPAPELAKVLRPLVGFFGELRERSVDFDLIGAVADLCPEIQFVLGGIQLDDISRLASRPNIHVVGVCPHEEMPARWRSLDLAILPYKHNSWLEVSEPVKLGEILATGIKAVGTPLASLKAHPNEVLTADTPDQFAKAIKRALKRPSQGGVRAQYSVKRPSELRTWSDIADEVSRLMGIGAPTLPGRDHPSVFA
jgi:glycosyltransferase involved in cell wall biosynthesis